MNSSVTLDSDTSVMSSLCLEISPSSRSNGPSKTSRCTSKAPAPRGASSGSAAFVVIIIHASPDVADHEAVIASRVQVGEQDRDRLPDQAPPVEDHPEPAQPQPRVLELKQFGGGKVDGDLLVVSFPARRLAFIGGGWRGRGGAQQLCDPGNAYPAGPTPSVRHRSSTSLASSR